MHRVFRRESALMPRLVRAVAPGDTARAALVARHFRDYQLGLHEHHTGEYELIWPLLLQRVDLEAELVLKMEEQHQRIAASPAAVEKLRPARERTARDGEPIVVALEEHRAAADLMRNLPAPAKVIWRFYGRRKYARDTRGLCRDVTPDVQ